mmetsp:Transcript_21951/g.62309  ORF Transcript_21951/g.62309 Transcript_21951/m.62309 type:complete len:265 (-) Transcript_21951:36-830(-)
MASTAGINAVWELGGETFDALEVVRPLPSPVPPPVLPWEQRRSEAASLAEAREELQGALRSREALRQAGALAEAREEELLAALAGCRAGAEEAEEACARQLEQLEHCQGRRQLLELADTELRAELHGESAALRRACERAEERQLRQQAQLESATQRAAQCSSEEEALRRALRVQEEAFRQRLEEERERAVDSEKQAATEAALASKASTPEHSHPGADREARYAQRLCEQLASLALQKPQHIGLQKQQRRSWGEPAVSTPRRWAA